VGDEPAAAPAKKAPGEGGKAPVGGDPSKKRKKQNT
jgi:hypothetical protein